MGLDQEPAEEWGGTENTQREDCGRYREMADLADARVNGSNAPADVNNARMNLGTSITTAPADFGIQSPKHELLSVGLVELLDVDDRPVFVLDLTSPSKTIPVYYNSSLQEIPLLELKIGKGVITSGKTERDPIYAAFIEWAAATTRLGGLTEVTYYGFRWKAKTIRKRWRVVYGEAGDHAEDVAALRRQSDFLRPGRSQTMDRVERRPWDGPKPCPNDSLEAQLSAFGLRREEEIQVFPSPAPREPVRKQDGNKSAEDIGRIDFTKPDPSLKLSPHHEFVLNFDWGSTDLGPINEWSTELRRMANILMSDPRPAAMYWGKHRTMLYNEPYVVVMGQKHPGMMGKQFSDAWAEVEGDFSLVFDTAYKTGTSYVLNDARFYIDRQGYLEETYYSIAIIPFSLEDGDVGFYNPVSDSTRQVIADRRMAFLLRLGQYIASSREPKDFWQQLLLALQGDHLDLPFAILYSAGGDINETLSESSEFSQSLRNWTLEGVIRVPGKCTILPKRINTEQTMEDFLPDFYELVKQESPTLLRADDGTLPEFISREITIIMDGEHPCKSAIFLPIRSTAENVLGFLILGVNPRRQFDDDYKVFIELLSRQLATSMASALLFEEEIRRGQMVAEQANHDRNILSKRLAIQRHEALEVETRFRRMADLAPVGMFHIDREGVLLYGNNEYYNMTGHDRNTVSEPMSWYRFLHEADHPIVDREWSKILGGAAVSLELRLKRPFVAEEIVPGEKVEGFAWIIAAAYPERADDGTVVGILGCITDISRQKWMEGFQTRKMMEAVELKRQQENFIDMTSHEMRNPLSAIIQCGDWIGSSLSEFGGESQNITIPRELVDGYADAAQTIVLCAQHQKRIIDDILTLSKLDSDLLFVTPVEVQPISVIQVALKMFDSELQKSDMELRFRTNPSYSRLAVDWVRLDPSRLLQVLINLTTNAIKFTQTEPKRRITISIGASTEIPTGKNGIEYLPRSSNRKDLSLGTAWGTGEMVYLHVEVEDTGRGLNENERNLLFRRFSQASPRTHVQYGGSGLGLFISRELTELQGGQIGVASKAGVGSTFAFYVRARRCTPPEDPKPINSYHVDMKAQSKIISPAAISRLQNGSKLPTHDQNPQLVAPKHVLIVEDNIVNQKVLSKQLRSAGCIVYVANHGGEALSFLSTTRFWAGKENSGVLLHVILMDLEMPVMDGLTCVKKIRELQAEGVLTRHVPVIAVTANARSQQITTAKDCGMDSVVTKPFRIPELLPEMDRQVQRWEERLVELDRPGSTPPYLEREA